MQFAVHNLLHSGPMDYAAGLTLQRDLVARRQQGEIPDTLLLLQHTPTVTFGKTTDPHHLLLTPDEYAHRGIVLVATDRGGDVTYHGPGQLVVYPIIHLGEGSRDLHRYVRRLEEVVIQTAHEFGAADAGRADWHAGVWVGDGYLAALGVKVSRWVTHHGIALNVTEAVQAGFATIVPCGVAGKLVVSLSERARQPVSLFAVADMIIRHFCAVFGYPVSSVSFDDVQDGVGNLSKAGGSDDTGIIHR